MSTDTHNSADPIVAIRERLAPFGERVQFVDREYDACGFNREVVCPSEAIRDVAETFRQAEYFLEMMAAIDCEGNASVCYTFNRWGDPDRTLVRLTVAYDESVPTISNIFPGAEWNEREAFELVGVSFDGHPNLKRLLLPEDADFFPLRKDYGIPPAIDKARAAHKKKLARLAAKKLAAEKAAAEKVAEKTAVEKSDEQKSGSADDSGDKAQ